MAEIGVATESERHDALSLVLTELEPSGRAFLVDSLASARHESLGPLDALLVARQNGQVAAATWAQPQTGDAASLWPPQAHEESSADYFEPLVRATLHVVDDAGVPLTQCLLETDDEHRGDVMQACGFEQIADLVYLGRSVTEPPTADKPTTLVSRPVAEADLPGVREVIAETYNGSLDCPELGDRRDIDATLRGYRAIGVSDLAGWRLLEHEREPVGIVITARHDGGDQAELVYMGLVESQRGRGLGKELVRHALATAFDWGAERIVTAADSRNHLARRAYQNAGFAEWNKRRAFVRFKK